MSAILTIERFQPGHMVALAEGVVSRLTWHQQKALTAMYDDRASGFTARRAATGEILFCGGYHELHTQRARMWAVYGESLTRREWGALLERTWRYIAELPHRRVEAEVDAREAMHLRWAERIGLRQEGEMCAAAPDGGDMLMMVRIERLGGEA